MRKLVLSGKGIFTGRGSLEALEQYTYEKVMIVTGGSSMMRTGVVDRVRGMLEKNNSHIVVYSEKSVYCGRTKRIGAMSCVWSGLYFSFGRRLRYGLCQSNPVVL